MLEKIDLTRTLSRVRYNALKPHLQRRLYDVEKACWDTAGQGTAINLLTSRLDPRGFKLYPIQAPRTLSSRRAPSPRHGPSSRATASGTPGSRP